MSKAKLPRSSKKTKASSDAARQNALPCIVILLLGFVLLGLLFFGALRSGM